MEFLRDEEAATPEFAKARFRAGVGVGEPEALVGTELRQEGLDKIADVFRGARLLNVDQEEGLALGRLSIMGPLEFPVEADESVLDRRVPPGRRVGFPTGDVQLGLDPCPLLASDPVDAFGKLSVVICHDGQPSGRID